MVGHVVRYWKGTRSDRCPIRCRSMTGTSPRHVRNGPRKIGMHIGRPRQRIAYVMEERGMNCNIMETADSRAVAAGPGIMTPTDAAPYVSSNGIYKIRLNGNNNKVGMQSIKNCRIAPSGRT